MPKKMYGTLGAYAFLLGVIGAGILGLLEYLGIYSPHTAVLWLLALAGLLIGLINIAKNEAVPYMVSAIMLGGVVTVFAFLPLVGDMLNAIFSMILIPVGIGAGVVAVKTIYKTSK